MNPTSKRAAMVYVSWILYEQLYNFLLYPNFWEINFKSSTESPVDKFLLHSKSLSLYLSQEQTLWGASPGLLQLYNVRSPCKWYSTFNWLSLPVSQRSLSACSPLTLVLAQWFWPSWLPRAEWDLFRHNREVELCVSATCQTTGFSAPFIKLRKFSYAAIVSLVFPLKKVSWNDLILDNLS